MDVLHIDEAQVIEQLLVFLELVKKLPAALHLLLDIGDLVHKIIIDGNEARLLNLLGMGTILEVEVFVFLQSEIVLRFELVVTLFGLEKLISIEF